MALFILCCCVSFHISKQDRKAYNDLLAKTRTRIAGECDDDATRSGGNPVSGTYHSEYLENGRVCKTTTLLNFTPVENGRGYTIDGSGTDSDGTFSIIEGKLSPSGSAYWVEESGPRLVLTRGRFNCDSSFSGGWTANNGVKSKYRNFQLFQPISGNAVVKESYGDTFFTGAAYKHSEDITAGIVFQYRRNGSLASQSVLISRLSPEGLFADTELEVGMHVLTINNCPVVSTQQAAALVRSAKGLVTILAIRSLGSETRHPDNLIVETAIKETADSKIGVYFSNKALGTVCISRIRADSVFNKTRLAPGMRVISINNSTVTSLEQALVLVSRTPQLVTILAKQETTRAQLPLATATPLNTNDDSQSISFDIPVAPSFVEI